MEKKEIYDLGELFPAVQLNGVFEDCKTFVDCIPKLDLDEIEEKFRVARSKPGFDYHIFIEQNFTLPPVYGGSYESDAGKSVEENIRSLWDTLSREPVPEDSSLLPLPYTYIVPGGRFREIYYWDSYFTMLGLKEHGRTDLVESMINNFAYLVNTYGHIPNGNRRYYLTRSQPPFFALMISLLADTKKDEQVFAKYLPELVAEYEFWHKGATSVNTTGTAESRVVKMPGGELLNRYFDDSALPRQESHAEDIELAKGSNHTPAQTFRHLRAGAESGWDFSSRWFKDPTDFHTIHTTDIVPVDLNCLLYTLEQTIAKGYQASGDEPSSAAFSEKAAVRKAAILNYCWNDSVNFFCDYDFVLEEQKSNITAAGLFPLFVNIATPVQAKSVAAITEAQLLRAGGIVTTTINSGQQWDAPNGWAPLQWISFAGLKNYDFVTLATTAAERWLSLNEKVFRSTGKLMEKYNVEDLDKPAGGGEYAGQDGFGWTNGIYVAMKHALDTSYSK